MGDNLSALADLRTGSISLGVAIRKSLSVVSKSGSDAVGSHIEGVKSVQILCPGFSADCLETLEEIDQENRAYFEEAGGERFEYIPCLNSDEEHIEYFWGYGEIIDKADIDEEEG